MVSEESVITNSSPDLYLGKGREKQITLCKYLHPEHFHTEKVIVK
jgi:hypothetical protein